MNSQKVSIIIPVYNGAKYLVECLDSIVGQDYNDIEIVIVNDGSNDATSDILSSYDFDNRPHLIIENKKNHGVSFCRNCGIKKSHGDLLLFVDADDIIAENTVSVLMRLYQEHKCTIKYQYYLKYKNRVLSKRKIISKNADWSSIMQDFILNRENCFSCLFLLDRNLLVSNNILFNNEEHYMEELTFIETVSHIEKELFVSNETLYGYRQTTFSVSHGMPIANKINAINARFLKYCDYFEDNGLRKEFAKSIVRLYLKTTNYFVALDTNTCSELRQKILNCIDEVFQATNLSIRDCSGFDRLLFGLLRTESYRNIKLLSRSRGLLLSLLGEKLYE